MKRVLALALLVGLFLAPGRAEARQQSAYAYPFAQVWATTVRMLRVDYGFPIEDRDEAIGYVLFDYQDQGQSVQGSVELVRIDTPSRPEVRVVFQIPSMPSYVERMLLDKLERKLREDYGAPAPVPGPTRPAAPPAEEPPADDAAPPTPTRPSSRAR